MAAANDTHAELNQVVTALSTAVDEFWVRTTFFCTRRLLILWTILTDTLGLGQTLYCHRCASGVKSIAGCIFFSTRKYWHGYNIHVSS